jgi:hypothetical protein
MVQSADALDPQCHRGLHRRTKFQIRCDTMNRRDCRQILGFDTQRFGRTSAVHCAAWTAWLSTMSPMPTAILAGSTADAPPWPRRTRCLGGHVRQAGSDCLRCGDQHTHWWREDVENNVTAVARLGIGLATGLGTWVVVAVRSSLVKCELRQGTEQGRTRNRAWQHSIHRWMSLCMLVLDRRVL